MKVIGPFYYLNITVMKLMVAACLCLNLIMADLFAEKHYQLVNLGLLDCQTSLASSINNHGQVSGIYKTSWGYSIFVWDPLKGLNNTGVELATFPIINNQGDIFGSYSCLLDKKSGDYVQEYVFKWQNPLEYLTFFNFRTLYYPASQQSNPYVAKRSIVRDVNDLGQILVANKLLDRIQENFSSLSEENEYKAWIYDQGCFFKIEEPSFIALKINNSSEVLGIMFTAENGLFKSESFKTVIYETKTQTFHPLSIRDCLGADINDKGQVVGVFYDPSNDSIRGFLKDPFNDITCLDNFIPKSINNQGQIIGKFMDGEWKNKPALWDNGSLCDLSDLVHLIDNEGHAWDSLDVLLDINDEGHIVGYGKYKGNKHGFLLVPVIN